MALVIAIALGLFLLRSSRPLEDITTYLIGAVPFGLTSGTAALVVGRWLHDRMKEGAYGEVVRAFDPHEVRTQLPYQVVSWASFLTALVAFLLLLVRDEFSRTVTALAYCVLAFLAAYSVLSWFSLLWINARHMQRIARLQSIKELAERERRAADNR